MIPGDLGRTSTLRRRRPAQRVVRGAGEGDAMRRQTPLIAAVVALALLAVTGCGGDGEVVSRKAKLAVTPSGSASPSPGTPLDGPVGSGPRPITPDLAASGAAASGTAKPAEAGVMLKAAAARLAGLGLRFTLGDDARRADGWYDARTGAATLSRVEDGKRVVVHVSGGELLLAGFAPDGSVLRVDVARLPASHELSPVVVPVIARQLLTGAKKVERHDREYAGRIDLNKVDLSGADAGSALAAQKFIGYLITKAGDRAGDVAFTATVDVEGRLSSLRASFPRADGGRDLGYEFVVVAVERTVEVARPSGRIVEAPTALYHS